MSGSDLALIGFIVLLAILLGFALITLVKMLLGSISLEFLIAEPDGKASLSRFQFLIFTFVVAGLFLLLSIESGGFVEIPGNVLGLLGISGGSFVVSKALSSQTTQKREELVTGLEKEKLATEAVKELETTRRTKAELRAQQGQPI